MLNYHSFHLKFGNRYPSKLMSPRIFKFTQFSLPKQSCYHYIPVVSSDIGPSGNNPLFKPVKSRVPMYCYMDISTRLGTLAMKSARQLADVRKHIKTNRKFRLVLDLDKGYRPEPIIPLVLNYALADKRYKYLGNTNRIDYYKNMNILNTVLKGMLDLYNTKGDYHNQFLFINVPKELIPISTMKRASSAAFTLEHYKIFSSLDKILIFELWKWLGLRREASLFKNIPQPLMDKINLVFIHNNVFSLFNMGVLNQWRQSDENPKGSIAPMLMGKQFIRLLLTLQSSVKDSSLIELTEEEQLELENIKEDNHIALEEDEFETDNLPSEENPTYLKETQEDSAEISQLEESSEEETEDVDDIEIEDYQLDKDLDVDVISHILDEEDDELEDAEIEAAKETNRLSKIVADKVTEQEPEFEIIEENLDASDVLGIKDIPIEEQYSLVSLPKEPKSLAEKGKAALNEIAEQENMTVSKYDGLKKQMNRYKEIQISKEDNRTIADYLEVKPEEIEISEEEKKENASTIDVISKKYNQNLLQKDVVGMLSSIQGNGVVIQNMVKSSVSNISDEYDTYAMKIKPVIGESSTIRVKIPKVQEDGTFLCGNSRYSLALQRRDLPIRKIDADTVALTTYFGKTFVRRETHRYNHYEKWLTQEIRKANFREENKTVLETRSANVFDYTLDAPNTYSILSRSFRAITTKECFIYLDYHRAKERFGEDKVRKIEANQLFFCGVYKKDYPLGMDKDNLLYYLDADHLVSLGSIEEVCGLPNKNIPVEAITVDIMGKPLPVALVLGYKYGLNKLLSHLKPKYYRTQAINTRLKLEAHEYAIAFNDFYLILSRRDKETSLIFGGLLKVEECSNVSIYSLNTKEIYFNLLDSIGVPGRYLKEIDLYYRMFVDPISERILIDMNYPTDFGGLLFKSVELLQDRKHKDETDITEQRIVGYERLAGEIYTQLIRSLREHNRHGIKANYPIELNPEAVWMSILKDTSKRMKEDLNPIQDIKGREEVTFVGNGGRGKKSMVKRTRAHHKTSIGIVSEATKDSSDAGITTFLSANPRFKNVYGIPENANTEEMIQETKPENVLSTAILMSPCSDTDDPKRALFVGTQYLQSIGAENYRVLPTRTGYDAKLIERCSDRYCATATDKGTVTEVNKFAITVKYQNGEEKRVEIGRRYGTSGSFATPHDITTNLKVGDSVNKGDIIAYHPGFFDKDPMNPGSLAYKYGALIKVALMENENTFEDSTAISREFANNTRVNTTTFKDVVVDFKQNVHRILTPGTEVNVGDVLCIIEDSITADTGLFDEDSIDLLKNLSNAAPKSGYKGIIDRIEVYYNGDKEDMSDSLRKITNITDNILSNKEKALGRKGVTGEVTETFRVGGKPLLIDTAVIRFSITTNQGISIGDKLTYVAQLKCTIAKVFEEGKSPRLNNPDNTPGEAVDAIFSTKSIYNRIVNSPFLVGMSNTLLIEGSKNVANLYFSNRD